jgi:hypothetical protein
MSSVFSVGQYVELYRTIPSSAGGSIVSGTRGIVRDIKVSARGSTRYLVGFLASERLTGDAAWVADEDLHAA